MQLKSFLAAAALLLVVEAEHVLTVAKGGALDFSKFGGVAIAARGVAAADQAAPGAVAMGGAMDLSKGAKKHTQNKRSKCKPNKSGASNSTSSVPAKAQISVTSTTSAATSTVSPFLFQNTTSSIGSANITSSIQFTTTSSSSAVAPDITSAFSLSSTEASTSSLASSTTSDDFSSSTIASSTIGTSSSSSSIVSSTESATTTSATGTTSASSSSSSIIESTSESTSSSSSTEATTDFTSSTSTTQSTTDFTTSTSETLTTPTPKAQATSTSSSSSTSSADFTTTSPPAVEITTPAIVPPASLGPITFRLVNKMPNDITISYQVGTYSPADGGPTTVASVLVGPTASTGVFAKETTVVAPVGWVGRMTIGKAGAPVDFRGTKIEGNNGFNGANPLADPNPDIDVSYVDGYSVPATCSCGDQVLSGCNRELFDLGNTCTNLVGDADHPVCVNDPRNFHGPATPFFSPCAHSAYTYDFDDAGANWQGQCPGNTFTCCIGTDCPTNPHLALVKTKREMMALVGARKRAGAARRIDV